MLTVCFAKEAPTSTRRHLPSKVLPNYLTYSVNSLFKFKHVKWLDHIDHIWSIRTFRFDIWGAYKDGYKFVELFHIQKAKLRWKESFENIKKKEKIRKLLPCLTLFHSSHFELFVAICLQLRFLLILIKFLNIRIFFGASFNHPCVCRIGFHL